MSGRVNFFLPDQFGYAAGYPYYAKYLTLYGYKVYVYCVDLGQRKISPCDGVSVEYVQIAKDKGTLSRLIELNRVFHSIIRCQDCRVVNILKYYPLCSMLTLFHCRTIHLDVRTGAISGDKFKNGVLDALLRLESSFFSHGFVLSDMMRRSLKLSSKRFSVLPLGADSLSRKKKDYTSRVSLIYVGTLNYRQIYKTIEGLSLAMSRVKIPMSYRIVGEGTSKEIQCILECITRLGLQDYVFLEGRMSHSEISSLFDQANVGVAFVPKIPMYNTQPSTKIFEYTLSGLFVLATDTEANKEVVTPDNGRLHDDTPESFSDALYWYVEHSNLIRENRVRGSLSRHQWPFIVQHNMIPYL